MKKTLLNIFVLLLLLVSSKAFSQVTISPSTFTAEDEITIRVDLSATPLAGIEPVYLWAFIPGGGGDALTNGSWTNSDEKAKFTKVSANIFEYKLVGTTAFGKSPAELKTLGFLVKSKDGGKQSADFGPFKFDPLVFSATQFRTFPAKVGQNDMISIFMDPKLASDELVKRMTASTISVGVYDSNGSQVGTDKTGTVTKTPEGFYSFAFIPTRLFTIPSGTKITKVKFKFIGTGRDANGISISQISNEGEISLLDFQ